MKPIEFKEQNLVFAKDQPEYFPLPSFRDEFGGVVTCWRLSIKERIKMLFSGRLWIATQTFNKPLQPIFLSVDKSEVIEEEYDNQE